LKLCYSALILGHFQDNMICVSWKLIESNNSLQKIASNCCCLHNLEKTAFLVAVVVIVQSSCNSKFLHFATHFAFLCGFQRHRVREYVFVQIVIMRPELGGLFVVDWLPLSSLKNDGAEKLKILHLRLLPEPTSALLVLSGNHHIDILCSQTTCFWKHPAI
jgi:hypothetical protein